MATALSLKIMAVFTMLTTMKKFSAWAQSAALGHLGRSPSSAIGKDKSRALIKITVLKSSYASGDLPSV